MIPHETVSKILDTARIEEVISDYITLKRRGANYVACCPFHNEKTPSFYVSPSKGIFKCFGCGKSGTAVGFVMEYEHISYVEALKHLASKYHIEIIDKEETAEDIARRQRNESLFIVSEYAGKFFHEQLKTPEGAAVGYEYFKTRGLEDETIEKYSLGWAPRSRHAFSEAALAAGYKEEYLVDTGLCVKNENGRIYDRFFDRVIFPVHSVSGRIIAFGGRTLRSDHTIAKYVNSKESEIYVKSRSLYGIYFAKNEISRRNKCYLVEGYLDVLSMHQLGILNVVASSGTSLTVDQIRMIRKFTDNVTIMYDGDAAGIHAALRGIGMVLNEGMNVKVVLIPDGDDPDSYSRKHNLEEVREFLSSEEKDFITYMTDLLLGEAGNDPLKKAELINDIADIIAYIPDAVKRNVYAEACGRKFDMDSEVLFERINSTRDKRLLEEKAEKRRRERFGGSAVSSENNIPSDTTANGLRETSVTDAVSITNFEDNKYLGAGERDLLGFILRYGSSPLEFPTDSDFYVHGEEPSRVAEFIFQALESDNLKLLNKIYKKVYDSYFKEFWNGLNQDEIVKTLMDGSDRETAFVASQLCQEKYRLTVRNFSDALTTPSSWLVKYVPHAIVVYKGLRLKFRINELTSAMKTADPDQAMDMFKQIKELRQAALACDVAAGRDNEEKI
ncbi:MAG: DNA primase [Bacteroidales bacterium]|jgi:DNA primase|nr:DNA primase [Bacteroidales bacterium]MCI1784601.1 DNA primase [Bacteroidales bacterium]